MTDFIFECLDAEQGLSFYRSTDHDIECGAPVWGISLNGKQLFATYSDNIEDIEAFLRRRQSLIAKDK